MRRKTNYLNNKDMLAEIHKSKISYCEYKDELYTDFDIVLDSIDEIKLEETIKAAKEKRALRTAHRNYQAALNDAPKGTKVKLASFKFDPETIPEKDLVFRVLTYEHIPLAPGRKRTPKTVADNYVKLNFIPFKHYIITDNGDFKEVLRSHSENGEFNNKHGSITDKLASMFILMVNKYGERGNWRGYCVDEETQALTKRGWLNIDEITTDDTILSCDEGNLKWSKIKSIFRDDYNGLMHHLTTKHSVDMLITPGHKLVTERGLVPVEMLLSSDRVVLMGNSLKDDHEKVHPDFIVQLYCQAWAKIGYIRELTEDSLIKNLSIDDVLSLTENQRELLINAIMKDNDRWYYLDDKSYTDLLQVLFTLSGYTSSLSFDENNECYRINIHYDSKSIDSTELDFHGGFGKSTSENKPTTQYEGRVWCPETEFGCFVAKRNNAVYLTGNSYLDEMKGQALLQLSLMGLQFNEQKSENPFAYFTQSCANAFTRVLNIEKRNQDLRDDLLIESGQNPSYSRQLQMEEATRLNRLKGLDNV